MNKGKVCISVCAKTASELLEQIERAEVLADVIEARIDCLDRNDIERAVSDLKTSKPLLLTFRPESQGGHAPDDPLQRIMFWASAVGNIGMELDQIWIDNEFDISSALQWSDEMTSIRSFHDFEGCPANISDIFQGLSQLGIAKIAVTARTITDGIPVWNLLDRARVEGNSMIPIAMGEAGKWTRILGPAHGAFLTYATLDPGSETAPGQITAEDMIDVYRVKELDTQTEVYGIVAGDTSYSISPWMHNAAFKASGMNRVFIPLQVADLGKFLTRMVRKETREVELNFAGFSVTNPHKQAIMPFLDEIDETARMIGAVNTVKIANGRFYGYNTDAPGFIAPLTKIYGDLRDANVAVVGAGGAARACIYALMKEGADPAVCGRDLKKAERVAGEFGCSAKRFEPDLELGGYDIVVNTTPLGTNGEDEDASIASAEGLRGVKLVYDLVYNPSVTRLIREARAANVSAIGGREMLIAQGAMQFKIWTGETAPIEVITAAVEKKLG